MTIRILMAAVAPCSTCTHACGINTEEAAATGRKQMCADCVTLAHASYVDRGLHADLSGASGVHVWHHAKLHRCMHASSWSG